MLIPPVAADIMINKKKTLGLNKNKVNQNLNCGFNKVYGH